MSIYHYITATFTMLSTAIPNLLAISFRLTASSNSRILVCVNLNPNDSDALYVTLYRTLSNPPENFQFHKNNYYSKV